MKIEPLALDLIKELVNIGMGRAVGLLHEMTGVHMELSAPEIRQIPREQADSLPLFRTKAGLNIVKIDFQGPVYGTSALVFTPESEHRLARLLLSGHHDESRDIPQALRIGVAQEMANIVLNNITGTMANVASQHLDYLPPLYIEDKTRCLLEHCKDASGDLLLILIDFSVLEQEVHTQAIILFDIMQSRDFIAAFSGLSPFIDTMRPAQQP